MKNILLRMQQTAFIKEKSMLVKLPYLAQQAGVSPNQLEPVHVFRKVKNNITLSIQTSDELLVS